MRKRILNILAISLPLQVAGVAWASANPTWVERYYSLGLYPYLSGFFRWLYGWVPFSVGDLLYLGVGAWVLVRVWRYRSRLKSDFWQLLRDAIAAFAVVHFTFYLLWGMNYFRQPLRETMALEEAYTQSELKAFTQALAKATNALQRELAGDSLQPVAVPYSRAEIQEKTIEGYRDLEARFPELAYRRPSLKPSLISGALSYMGYGGYLNPFTGEAQVNARLPLFRYPVVCGHEVGHQLGYSAENETNFIGYLVSVYHPDPYFRYSATAFALSYCLSELHANSPERAKEVLDSLTPGVRANYQEVRDFWESYANPLEPVFKAVFNTYLEANRQKDGIRSYNRVVSLMLAYHREVPLDGF
ncbi:DUF3810 domain-containing protein [Robiginitalea sediminis]|uniref:DUF3810 domain-containing protein n=1 Tax=Robiginitalea sediminis TaxID=1982593 RepID=UPI000B4BAF09|nr:DUF3810 domain-containing protein [Robiginitalea sediminis]